MLRAARYIIIAAILMALAWLVGNLPGTVTAHSGRYTVETSVPAAILLLLLLAWLATWALRLLGGLRRAPGGLKNWRGGRRRALGELATRRGMVALAAGDAPAAATEAARARKLLGDEPLALLLSAEAARLTGKPEEARAAFEKLAIHKDMAFLGHKGLLRHQLAAGDHAAAEPHAAAAAASYPGSSWVQSKKLELAIKQQDWGQALRLTSNKSEIAAFATGATQASTDARTAVKFGQQAVKADPALAPGVVAYAKALLAAGRARAAKRALLAGWKTAPHPLIAQAWLAPVATPIERARAASTLAAANPGHAESEILLAQTALAAQLTGEARRHAETVMEAGGPDDRAAQILSTLEGNGQPLATKTAQQWVCSACHMPAAEWAPACPNCHLPASLKWDSQPGHGTLLA